MDGVSLGFYLRHLNQPKTGLAEWLLGVIVSSPALLMVLSIWTVVFELGCITMLFVPRSRWPIVINAWAVHVGIWLLMMPHYWPQMVCYLLLVPWEVFRSDSLKDVLRCLVGAQAPPQTTACRGLPGLAAQRWLVGLATTMSAAFLITMAYHIEWYPFTAIPMYSTYVDDHRLGTMPREAYGSLAALTRVAALGPNDMQPFYGMFEIGNRIRLRGYTPDGDSVEIVDFPDAVVNRWLWYKRMSDALLNDLRNTGGQAASSSHRLRECEAIFETVWDRIRGRPEWRDFRRFELVLMGDGQGQAVLATGDREPQ